MKKVVMFAGPQHEIPPTKGAAVQTWIYEVSKRILQYQTHIISISHDFMPLKEFDNGIYFHRIFISKLYKRIFQKILGWDIYSYNKRIFQIIKDINPDIVHIHNYYDSKEIINWINKYNKKIKIILHIHNQSEKFLEKKFSEIDSFIGCSNFITNYYKSNNLINAKHYTTIYNGVDIDKFQKSSKSKSKINKFIDNQNKTNIFYFGRISEEKGVDVFVDLALLFNNNSNFHFYCVGEISKGGGRKTYFENLNNKIEQNNINNITFLDYVSPHKIHYTYQLANIIIIPSRFEEPFCMVAVEAMASNIPIICSSKGGMKEYLNHKNNSFVIENYKNFTQEAFNYINELISTSQLYTKITKSAFETVNENFDWFDISTSLENHYNMITK